MPAGTSELRTATNVVAWCTPPLPVSRGGVALLMPAEVARADRFHRAADRDRFVTGRALARAVLGDVLGVPARAVRLRVDAGEEPTPGRPRVAGGPTFSISHAGAWVLVAVAGAGAVAGVEVGVDVEAVTAVGGLFDDLREAVPAQESPPGGWDARSLTRSWVRREAVLKAVGTGLLAPRDDLLLARADDAAAVVRTRGRLPDRDRLALHDLDLPGGTDHLAAVALHGAGLGTVVLADGAGLLARHGVRHPAPTTTAARAHTGRCPAPGPRVH